MAKVYGYDIFRACKKNAHEAFQWLYFGYSAAIKIQNAGNECWTYLHIPWISILKETLRMA